MVSREQQKQCGDLLTNLVSLSLQTLNTCDPSTALCHCLACTPRSPYPALTVFQILKHLLAFKHLFVNLLPDRDSSPQILTCLCSS